MFVVIMAGGSGTRFWPMSRKSKPKQFLNITGRGPMVLETCERVQPLAGDEEIILVLGREHLREAKALFKERSVHLLAEPVGRNTAPCIGLGALYADYLGCQGPIAFLPADHFIGDPASFVRAVERARELAEGGGIVTLGITPNRPETGYGYIQRARNGGGRTGQGAFRVSRFVEKPDLETARRYLASGDYYWNAGIFVATAQTIARQIEALLPDLHHALQQVKESLGSSEFEDTLNSVYEGLESVSFDYGIMERTWEDIYVVPCECGWSDVGSWRSLYELMSSEHDRRDNLTQGDTLLIDCEKSFVSGTNGRLVACLGLKNSLVVDTPDIVLVADMARSQDIRRIVDELRRLGKEKHL